MIIHGRSYSKKGIFFLFILILNGVIFTGSLPALFSTSTALLIHSDLYPDTSDLMIQAKSVICFLTGLTYFIAAYAFHHKNPLIIIGTIGAVPFFLLYLIEIFLWGLLYPRVWIGFSIFGIISLIIAIYCWFLWKTRFGEFS